MNQTDRTAFKKKLDDFSHRLDQRIKEFGERGEFSDVHKRVADQIHQDQNQLRQKVHAAEQHGGRTWDLLKAEFNRDYSSLFDKLLQLEERLDAETMRKKSE